MTPNYTNDLSETWYVTISDSTPSPSLEISTTKVTQKWFFFVLYVVLLSKMDLVAPNANLQALI